MGFFAPFRAKRPPSAALADKRRLGKIRAERQKFLPEKIFFAAPRAAKRGQSWTTTYRAAKLLNLLCRIWRIFSGFCPIGPAAFSQRLGKIRAERRFFCPKKFFEKIFFRAFCRPVSAKNRAGNLARYLVQRFWRPNHSAGG